MDHQGEMTDGRWDLGALARSIVDSNLYMTLATADAEGRPWASPVWFAHEGYREFLWVSRPESRHSRNVAARPELALVIFDSTVTPWDAAAVYVEGRGEELRVRPGPLPWSHRPPGSFPSRPIPRTLSNAL